MLTGQILSPTFGGTLTSLAFPQCHINLTSLAVHFFRPGRHCTTFLTSQAHLYVHIIGLSVCARHILTRICLHADVLGGPGIPAVHSLLACCCECIPRSRMGIYYGGAAGTPSASAVFLC